MSLLTTYSPFKVLQSVVLCMVAPFPSKERTNLSPFGAACVVPVAVVDVQTHDVPGSVVVIDEVAFVVVAVFGVVVATAFDDEAVMGTNCVELALLGVYFKNCIL